MATPITRTYSDFAGVDFFNDPSMVSITRSPDAVNIYKDYQSEHGGCIQTRPGYRQIAKLENKINSMFIFNINTMLIHSGSNLYEWTNFPSEPTKEDMILLRETMNPNTEASFVMFQNKAYINDGMNYLVYDGENLKDVKEDAFIPTTTIRKITKWRRRTISRYKHITTNKKK